MHFDYTISLGNVLTAMGLFVGLLAAHMQNVRRLERIEVKVNLVFDWFVKNLHIVNNVD